MPPKSLLDLAREKFGELSDAEVTLFEATEEGEPAVVSVHDEGTNPSIANLPVIKTDCLAWLMTDRRARQKITYKGVTIWGAKIDGLLDLSFIDWPWQFRLLFCHVPNVMILQNAIFGLINFNGTHTGPISADGIKVNGGVFLRNDFSAHGEVRFFGAIIDGHFDCSSGKFCNETGRAINADGITLSGGVFFADEFFAQGEVRFLSAKIGGDFTCGGGVFYNENGYALSLDRCRISGNVFLHKNFNAFGEVRFIGADVIGDIDCSDGVFWNNKGKALNADGINVKGNVFLRNGLNVKGAIQFRGASISGNFDCTNATLSAYEHFSINAEKVKIGGNMCFRGLDGLEQIRLVSAEVAGVMSINSIMWRDCGVLDLRQAKIKTLYDDENWPEYGNILLDGFSYAAIADKSPLSVKKRIKWLERQPDDQFYSQPYEQLASFYKYIGDEEAGREVQIAKNEKRRRKRSESTWLQCVWLWLLKWLTGYGYRPGRIAFSMLMIVFIGTLIFLWGNYSAGMTSSASFYVYEQKVGDPKPLPGTEEFKLAHKTDGSMRHILTDDYPHFNAFFYSIDTFLPLVDLYQQNYWMPNANTAFGCFLRWYLLFHILMGWFLTSLLVASFTGLIKQ